MAYELTISKTTAFKNPKLEQLTSEMATVLSAVMQADNSAKILCAKHINTIEAEELYKEDGFESILDFVLNVMKMPKSTAYMYIQVGRALNLGQIPEVDADGRIFTLTQLRSMCAAKDTRKLSEAVESGEVNAAQSSKEVDAAIADMNPAKTARKAPAEKRYVWEEVGTGEESSDASKTELITAIAEHGGTFIGELKSDDDFYIVAIGEDGYPIMYRRGDEVKKVVESK